MGLYNIVFFFVCIAIICLAFVGVSKNILTQYGVGLLIAIFVFVIIGYDLWVNFYVCETMRKIELLPTDAEKEIILQELIKRIGTQP
jgi:hypothetical protein